MRYASILILASCASSSEPMAVRFTNAAPVAAADDRRAVASKPSRNLNLNDYDFYERAFEDPVVRSLELPGHRRARGSTARRGARFDVVHEPHRDAGTSRPTRFARALSTHDGPEAHKPWTIHSTKPGGTEVGFVITDARGVKYLISFDDMSRPEMETGAGIIVNACSGRRLQRPGRFDRYIPARGSRARARRLCEGSPRIDRGPLDAESSNRKLLRAWRTPDGQLRALASRYLAGESLGGSPPSGVRDDDPNDHIPHELRRDQRGLYPLTAWVDHIDLSAEQLPRHVRRGSARIRTRTTSSIT